MRNSWKPAVFSLCLLVLAACAAKSPMDSVEPQVAVPDAWQQPDSSAGETVQDDWWTAWNDPVLNELVMTALAQNPDIRQAAARLDQMNALVRVADANRLPSINGGFDGRRNRQNFIGLPIPGAEGQVVSTTSTSLGLSLNTTWEVDLWGRLRAEGRQALAEAQASAADWQGARLSIAGQTVKAYLAMAEAREQIRLAQATVDSYRVSLNQVQQRYDRGLRGALDLRLARANLAQAEEALLARQQQQDRAVRRLETLLGRYPGGKLTTSVNLPPLPSEVPGGLPADIVARRPDIAAAERRLAAADQRWVQADRQRYPRISLTVSGGTSSSDLGDLLDGDFSVWSLIAGLSQPIFQGGRIRAGIDAAAAAIDVHLAAYTKVVLQAYADVENALAAEQFWQQRLDLLDAAAADNLAAEELASSRYREGLDPFLNVLESQRRALQVQSAEIAARASLLNNRVDLYLALGGGFSYQPGRSDLVVEENDR